MLALPRAATLRLQIDTPHTTQMPVNTSAPARGFFAPRNRLQDLSTTLHPDISDRVDGESRTPGVDQQANGA